MFLKGLMARNQQGPAAPRSPPLTFLLPQELILFCLFLPHSSSLTIPPLQSTKELYRSKVFTDRHGRAQAKRRNRLAYDGSLPATTSSRSLTVQGAPAPSGGAGKGTPPNPQ